MRVDNGAGVGFQCCLLCFERLALIRAGEAH